MAYSTKTPPKAKLPVELLRELLSYEPSTGSLVWRERGPHHFRSKRLSSAGAAVIWNAQHAGKSVPASRGSGGTFNILGRCIGPHVAAFAIYYGRYPEGVLGRRNGDRSDNRVANLVEGIRSRSGTAVGVTLQNGGWAATISVNKRRHYLGTFADRKDALAARRAGELKHGFSGSCRPRGVNGDPAADRGAV